MSSLSDGPKIWIKLRSLYLVIPSNPDIMLLALNIKYTYLRHFLNIDIIEDVPFIIHSSRANNRNICKLDSHFYIRSRSSLSLFSQMERPQTSDGFSILYNTLDLYWGLGILGVLS